MLDEPAAPKKRDPRALNAYRHGLTGQVHIFSPADQVAYEKHSKSIHESLAPVGGIETDLAQAIAVDRWRLNHAAGIEGSIFAIGTGQIKDGSHNNPDIARDYPHEAIPPQFDFSNALILRLVAHRRRLKNSKRLFPQAMKPLQTPAGRADVASISGYGAKSTGHGQFAG